MNWKLICAGSLLSCAMLMNGADFNYIFSPERNTFDAFSPTQNYLGVLGKKIFVENKNGRVLLKTNESNCQFLGRVPFENGEVSFRFKLLWPGDISLIARADKTGYNTYRLTYLSRKKEIMLTRTGNRKAVLKIVLLPSVSDDITLALQFNGKTIVPVVNGVSYPGVPDDGSLKNGVCGFATQYYGNIELLSFAQKEQILQHPPTPAPAPAPRNRTPYKVNNARKIEPGKISFDLAKAWRKQDGSRLRISLNQFWQFAPVEKDGFGKMPEKYGFFSVPGHWREGEVTDFMYLPDGRPLAEWCGKRVSSYPAAWYRRTLNIPESFRGKKLELVFEHIKGAFRIFINGKERFHNRIDEISRQTYDVTADLIPGKENVLSVWIEGKRRAGLYGPVFLDVLPKWNFGMPSLETSVTKKELSIRFPKANFPVGGTLEFRILDDKTGKEVFSKKTACASSLKFSWIAPKLWSPEEPNLYRAEFRLRDASGAELDHSARRFGFREFRVEKGAYLLNGNPYILKLETGVPGQWTPNWHHNPVFVRRMIQLRKKMNLNAMYVSEDSGPVLYDTADELGILLIAKTKIFEHDDLNKADGKFYQDMEAYLRNDRSTGKYENHPSLVGFLIDVWYNFHTGTHNPHFVGMDQRKSMHKMFQVDGRLTERRMSDPNLIGIYSQRKDRLDRLASVYRKIFPGMEFFTGGSGQVGTIYATHMYHTWGAPLAELRTFFEAWSKDRELPLFIGEMTQPYIGAFYEIDNFHGSSRKSLFKENAARIFGNKAYEYRSVYSKRPFHDRTPGSYKFHTTEKKPSERGIYLFSSEIYLDVLNHYLSNMNLPWRMQGVNGIGNFEYESLILACHTHDLSKNALPENYSDPEYKPGKLDHGNANFPRFNVSPGSPSDLRPLAGFAPFARSMANVSLAIMNGGEDNYLQDHAFYAGSFVRKTIVILNDSMKKTTFRLVIQLRNPENRIVEERTIPVNVEAFEQKRVPVEFNLPQVCNREEWLLSVNAIPNQGNELKDSFAFQIFPMPSPIMLSPKKSLFVFDPEKSGLLTRELKIRKMGFTKLNSLNDLPKKPGILLIGRKGLSGTSSLPELKNLADLGWNILLMEQEANRSPELMKTRTRTAFINAQGHPIFNGLKDADFSNWNGSHGLEKPYGLPVAGAVWSDWGNRNMLATNVYRRPPHGNYRSLLVNGFDLFQTPLLEYVGQKGNLIASQLDMTERFQSDPVVATLFRNLIYYLDQYGTSAGRTVCFADKNGLEWLRKMKIDAKNVKALTPENLKNVSSLLIVNPDFSELKKYRFELNDFVWWGGRVFYIQLGKNFDSSWLPFTMNLTETSARGALLGRMAGDSLWANGWDNNDLYWHDLTKVPIFSGFPPDSDQTDPAVLLRRKSGSGEFIFVSITPELFGNTAATGKTSRLLSALLTSAGIPIETAPFPFLRKNDTEKKLDLSEMTWEFALDPENKGLSEGWPHGKGAGRWIKGLIADGIEVRVGQYFENFLRKEYDGYAWYRLRFDCPSGFANGNFYFIAGAIDDFDEVYLNGRQIGKTGKETPKWWESMRVYQIPDGLLKPNGNLLTVRVFDEKGQGGICKMPVMMSNTVPKTERGWKSPYLQGSARDYDYKADIIRMY